MSDKNAFTFSNDLQRTISFSQSSRNGNPIFYCFEDFLRKAFYLPPACLIVKRVFYWNNKKFSFQNVKAL